MTEANESDSALHKVDPPIFSWKGVMHYSSKLSNIAGEDDSENRGNHNDKCRNRNSWIDGWADMPVDDLPKAFSPGKILVLTMMKIDDGEQNKQDGQADMREN